MLWLHIPFWDLGSMPERTEFNHQDPRVPPWPISSPASQLLIPRVPPGSGPGSGAVLPSLIRASSSWKECGAYIFFRFESHSWPFCSTLWPHPQFYIAMFDPHLWSSQSQISVQTCWSAEQVPQCYHPYWPALFFVCAIFGFVAIAQLLYKYKLCSWLVYTAHYISLKVGNSNLHFWGSCE